MTEQQNTEEAGRTPAKRTTSTGRTLVAADQDTAEAVAAKLLPVPGAENVLFDQGAERLVKRKGSSIVVYLDWAPLLEAWWPGQDGSIIYRVTVHGQTDEVITETLRDGTAWDAFDYAAGHDTRQVREALASVVKMQRREMAPAPGLNSLGWHEVAGEWVYASADTVFGPAGPVTAVTQIYDADECTLPEAPTGDRLREVVSATLKMLDAAVPRVAVPTLAWVWLAPLVSLFPETAMPRFVAWTWSNGAAGVFGVFKSNYAAIAQAHSGTGYQSEADLLPAADTTVPSLAAILVARKDTLVLIDDYKPGETSTVSNKTQGTAEQGLRLGTNRQNRQIRRHRGPGGGGKGKNAALLWYTAECLPLFDSGSTHDRTFPVQVNKGDISADGLTELQSAMDAYPESGAAYVAWLAANHAKIRTYLAERFPQLRTALKSGGQVDGRACVHIAHMLCALEVGTQFACDAGAMTEQRRAVFLELAAAALIENASATVTERSEDQPAAVWLNGLRSLFSSGRYYAATKSGEGRPQHSRSLGWTSGDIYPQGRTCIGYATEDGLAVIESVANGAIGKLARDAGASLAISGVDLRRTLAGAGVLRPRPDTKHEHQWQQRIGDDRQWYPVVPWAVFLGEDGETGATAAAGEQQPAPTATPADAGPAAEQPMIPGARPASDPITEPAPIAGMFDALIGDMRDAATLERLESVVQDVLDTKDEPAYGIGEAQLGELRAEYARQRARLEQPAATLATAPAPAPETAPAAPAYRRRSSRPAAPKSYATPLEARRGAALEAAGERGLLAYSTQRDALAAALAKVDDLALIDDATLTEEDRASLAHGLRVLAAMEGDGKRHGPFAPYLDRRGPWWQASMPDPIERMRVLNWNFKRDDYTGPAVVLDRSGAWPTAASSATVAHGGLNHTGEISELKSGTLAPGIYQVEAFPWDEKGLPSPLSSAKPGTRVWVPAPRAQLLRDLAEAGRWPEAVAHDSYTGTPVRLTKWAGFVGELRRYARENYRGQLPDELVKIAFGQAMGLLVGSWVDDEETGQQRRVWKCKARRPDWKLTIEDQSAVTLWRVADGCLKLAPEAGPLAIRNMDELIIPAGALEAVTGEQPNGARPPVRIDETGITYGTFKTKATEAWGE